jgi:hypothetical protein
VSKDLASHDSDVVLAVKMNSQNRNMEVEEEEGMDEFLSSHGFEYIDGDNVTGRRALDDEDVTGRVLLALSLYASLFISLVIIQAPPGSHESWTH